MKITMKAVRIYASKSSYGTEPRLMPERGYIELPKYPSEKETSFVVLGNPIKGLFDAKSIVIAVGKSMLGRLKGLSLDDGVRECLAKRGKGDGSIFPLFHPSSASLSVLSRLLLYIFGPPPL